MKSNQCKWIEVRRDMHINPELGFNEHRTSDFIAKTLESFGIETYRNIGRTGVIGVIHGSKKGRVIGLRADIDALPMNDESDTLWKSKNAGVSHGCGHDGHTIMLLAAAENIVSKKNLCGTVILIFQPAEELLVGAKEMIDDGLFERFPCDAVYAIHNWPGIPEGEIHTKPGPIMAAADKFEIKFIGKGGHAAQPHLSPDTILAISELVVSINSIIPRNISPTEPALLTVTKISGGTSYNMIPSSSEIFGTVRTFSDESRNLIEKIVKLKSESIAKAYGLSVKIEYKKYCPATINTVRESEIAIMAAERVGIKTKVLENPAMTSEDFSFMLQKNSGAYVWLGAGDGYHLHHPNFDFNDNLIPLGAKWLSSVIDIELSL